MASVTRSRDHPHAEGYEEKADKVAASIEAVGAYNNRAIMSEEEESKTDLSGGDSGDETDAYLYWFEPLLP